MDILKSKLKPLYHRLVFNPKADRKFIHHYYSKKFGYAPNLEQPETFNEKLQWLKLNDRGLLKTVLADKLAVREIVKISIGEQYLVPLVASMSDVSELTHELLPDYPVIIKSNHASGKVFIVRDKAEADFPSIRQALKKFLNYNFYHSLREWQYKNIPSRVIVEKLLQQPNGEVPDDYKVHCFNGKAKFIQLDSERFKGHKRRIYDTNWQPQDFEYNFPLADPVDAPEQLPQLLELAEKLAKPFNYCRIDFYVVDGQIYFGEYTFTPEGGFGSFKPAEIDRQWGALFEVDVK